MPAPRPPIDVETTVLPPDGKGRAPRGKEGDQASEASRIVAKWMDEFIRIPGTNFRIGLDPIIGLFPGIGDLLASSVGLVLMTEGIRSRLPVSVLVRMGGNMLINDLGGSIPVLGDIFSAWFKSNSRNLRLLNQWKTGDQQALRRGSRIFMGVFIVIWLSLLVLWVYIWVSIVSFVFTGLKNFWGA